MQEPFDIEIGEITYSVFPEEQNTFEVFKEGEFHFTIQKDTENIWLKLHPDTGTIIFERDEEVELVGKYIYEYTSK